KGFGVGDRSSNFQAVPYDPRIRQQLLRLLGSVSGDLTRVKIVKGLTVIFATLQNRVPAQTRLRAFEGQELEQDAFVVLRNAPFRIVVAPHEWAHFTPTAPRFHSVIIPTTDEKLAHLTSDIKVISF